MTERAAIWPKIEALWVNNHAFDRGPAVGRPGMAGLFFPCVRVGGLPGVPTHTLPRALRSSSVSGVSYTFSRLVDLDH
jgi:hypothetical protein